MTRMVAYTLLATLFILLLNYQNLSKTNTHHCSSLGRRGYKGPIFDPFIVELDRSKDDNNNNDNNNSVGYGISFAEDYFGNGGKLNISLRLTVLFPMLDDAPKDGGVDFKELEIWNTKLAMDRLIYRTEMELGSHDKNGDGAIDFREYFPKYTDEDIEKNDMGHGEAGWWKEQFVNADFDRSQSLNFNEFKDFLHPEDSENKEIQKWLLRERIKRMDYNHDGKLNLEEFNKGAYDSYKNYVEYETAGADSPTSEDKFSELDVDNDKVLTVDELTSILHYLYPGELSYAKYFTSYLIREADDNRDGVLSLTEMINHEYIFYSTVYDANHEDDYDDYHDEL